MTRFVVLVCLVAAAATCAAEATAREPDAYRRCLPEGRWRLELSAWKGIDAGKVERNDDTSTQLAIEYEVPFGSRFTTGLRATPLFLYDDQNADNTIYGFALGPTLRAYWSGNRSLTRDGETRCCRQRSGWFFEAGISGMIHNRRFFENASNVNFMTEIGIGYSFSGRWHVALKWHHISSANMDRPNAATEGIGLAVGFTF